MAAKPRGTSINVSKKTERRSTDQEREESDDTEKSPITSTPRNSLAHSGSLSSLFSLRGRERGKRRVSDEPRTSRKRKSRSDDDDSVSDNNENGEAQDQEHSDQSSFQSSKGDTSSVFNPSKSLLSLVMARGDNGGTLKRSKSSSSTAISKRRRGSFKRQRTMSMEEEAETKRRLLEVEEHEKKLDEELEPQYRKFRPRGFRLNPPPKDRPVRIYADGVFDLFHLGHMRQLEQAKKSLPNVVLVVGVPNDEVTHKLKGLTVLTDKQRYESLRHCKWVDEVVENAPWVISQTFLEKHNIDYVAHDDLPYVSAGSDDIYKPIKELGKFLVTQRTDGISTSDIITKIIRDYDKYLMRNFARGASRQDLNVSWLKKNEIELKRHVNEFRESFKTNLETARTSRDWYGDMMSYVSGVLHKDRDHDRTDSRSPSSDQENDSDENDEDQAHKQAMAAAATSLGISQDSSPYRRRSPISDFASNYSGGRPKRNFLNNVRDWMSRRSDHDMSSLPGSESD